MTQTNAICVHSIVIYATLIEIVLSASTKTIGSSTHPPKDVTRNQDFTKVNRMQQLDVQAIACSVFLRMFVQFVISDTDSQEILVKVKMIGQTSGYL